MSALLDLAQSIQDSDIGTAIAESRFAFPIIEGTHLSGLSLSVGLIFLTDLRLLGVLFRGVPIETVLKSLRPYIMTGFALVFISGGLLTWSEAVSVVESPATPWKFIFMILAGLNAAYFEFVIAPRFAHFPERSERTVKIPVSVRVAGGASLGLWVLVIVFGRLIAYLPK